AELGLLRTPVSSIAIDQWLPSGTVMVGDEFELDSAAVCSVLNLTTVDGGIVNGEVVSISGDEVRFQIKGDVEASIDGVSTRLRLIGKLTYDRNVRGCSWLALGLHETRESSLGEPGFDVAATIRMLRRPLESPIRLPAEAPAVEWDDAVSPDLLFVEMRSRARGVGTMVDRRWKMIQDGPGTTILRIIDHGMSVAQCNLRSLPAFPGGKQLTLEGFEADVRQTLGKGLTQLISGDQAVSAQGLRVLRIVADGKSQGVPLRWIIMHFSDDEGKRLQATFTMSADQIESFAGSDLQFADSLRFLKSMDRPNGDQDAEVTNAPVASQTQSRVAEIPEDEQAVSASDFR
ncbi:MAG: hypothetical protein AAGJ83_09945, partial [Planctomycetota bacterium]